MVVSVYGVLEACKYIEYWICTYQGDIVLEFGYYPLRTTPP